MASTRTNLTAKDFDRLSEKLIKLSTIQDELRDGVAAFIKKEKLTRGGFASLIGVQHGEVNGLLEKKRTVCGGKFLEQLIIILERPDLRTEIAHAKDGLKDWQCGAALFSPEIIRLTVRMQKTWVSQHATYETFAELFAPHQALAVGVLKFSLESLAKLSVQEIKTFNRILDTPQEDLMSKLSHIQTAQTEQIKEKVRELEQLLHQLRPRYAYKGELAVPLGFSRSTLQYARRGKVSEKTMNEILVRARDLVAQSSPQDTSSTNLPDFAPERQGIAPVSDTRENNNHEPSTETLSEGARGNQIRMERELLTIDAESVAGPTSPDGVRFVLTRASFKEVELDPGYIKEWLMSAKRKLEAARFMLNIGAQLVHDQHELIREVLGPQVRELYLSLEIFSVEHPNEVTPLFDAQRNTFLARKNASKSIEWKEG